ncbi:hypothetical protein [Actinoplanes sp. NPDC049265]|uniref:hypothetical protein n=1 Tax=Actinoplanes sp. NPDC049265 TaxID=3363902 RepID=UPI00371B7158
MSNHRGRGRGRYRLRPRHRQPVRAATVFAFCATLSLLSLALIGARLVQAQVHRPVAIFQQSRSAAVTMPKAYTPEHGTAREQRQHRKQRPPTVLGRLDQAGMTRYCVATTGPLTTAEFQDGRWMCKPFLGTAVKADVTAACRLIFDDAKAVARDGRCVK